MRLRNIVHGANDKMNKVERNGGIGLNSSEIKDLISTMDKNSSKSQTKKSKKKVNHIKFLLIILGKSL